ncbi:NAD(P)-dependent oxidoreductase [Bordetella sp. BOR01]|uniref:NAD-dependent epimerase/dehydratase family protein n=1 Tax=Bordetella sp. BOR01 TaxID=2854779 RepID=UPI001C46E73D|nr:NAD(P)-dependent oxidoreductase [Bordetella sp. BOR01]MBV7484767.1 NAD(P)-dependent oxidoreductase [Bordetella sp. BOR01]
MSQRILVTGAAGWLGIAIVKALLARGDEVVALDLRVTPALAGLKQRHPGLTPVEADLGEWSQVIDAFKAHEPQAVVHTAAIVGVALAADVPIKAMRVNTEGSVNLFEAMRHFGVRRVVHISTEETYGDFTAQIIDENHPQRPTSIYGLTKLAAEHYGRVYADRHGLECINVRTCWVYGPDLPRARVPKVFVDAALAGGSYHLRTGGDLAVDQVYIDDTVAGVLLALDKQHHRFDAYHIATGQAPTIDDVARIVRELVPGANVTTAPGWYLHGDRYPTARKGALDISRARKELGYAPQYDLRRGIEATVQAARAMPG